MFIQYYIKIIWEFISSKPQIRKEFVFFNGQFFAKDFMKYYPYSCHTSTPSWQWANRERPFQDPMIFGLSSLFSINSPCIRFLYPLKIPTHPWKHWLNKTWWSLSWNPSRRFHHFTLFSMSKNIFSLEQCVLSITFILFPDSNSALNSKCSSLSLAYSINSINVILNDWNERLSWFLHNKFIGISSHIRWKASRHGLIQN